VPVEPLSVAVPALRTAQQVISWAYRSETTAAPQLKSPSIDVATIVDLADSADEKVLVTSQQATEIGQFLADPAVVSFIRLLFISKWAQPGEVEFLAEVANESTFLELAGVWCTARSQTWLGVVKTLWRQINQGQDLLLQRTLAEFREHASASDEIIQRFFFGAIATGSAPEYVRRINELAHNLERQQDLNDLLSECNSLDQKKDHEHFVVMGIDQDVVTFEGLYIDRTLSDAATGGALSAKDELDIQRVNPRVVIIGDPGVGKSTLTVWAKWRIQESHTYGYNPAVITLISRYDLTDTGMTLLDAVRARFESDYTTEIEASTLADLLSTGWILLIVDGIDEILDPVQRRRVVTQLNTLAEKYPFTPIVCTTRRTGFEVSVFASSNFKLVNLEQYTADQVAEYARKWFRRQEDGLKADRFLGESRTLGELRRNPLMLALLCTLYRQYDYIPESRRDVYLRCAQLMFYEWDPRRGIAIPNLFKKEGEALLRDIALLLYSAGGVGSSIDESQLTGLIKSYLIDRGQEQLAAGQAARELLDHCSRRAWILTKIGSSGRTNRFSFTHTKN
jgi:hypothetical protein